MSHYEQLFPVDISYGAVGGPMFKTAIVVVDSGYESRNIAWAAGRIEYDVSHGVKTTAQADALLDFFRAMRGKAHSFLFLDNADYAVTNEALPFGTSATIQLIKTYTVGSASEVRTITKPKVGTVTARKNSVSTPVTFSTTTGILTLTAGAPLITDVIDWTGEFYVPMRFDTDRMDLVQKGPGLFVWSSIPVIEIRV